MKAEDLVGTWIGRGRDYLAADGSVSRSGPDYPAWLVYTREGLVIVISTPHESSGDAVVAYAGPYEVRDGKIIHHSQVSISPAWVGKSNERTPKLDGNRLILHTEPDARGGVSRIYWERVDKVPNAKV
jgi:hypothetical protein